MIYTAPTALPHHREIQIDAALRRVHAAASTYNGPLRALFYITVGALPGAGAVYSAQGVDALWYFCKLLGLSVATLLGYWGYLRHEGAAALSNLYRVAEQAAPPYIYVSVLPGAWTLRTSHEPPQPYPNGPLIIPLNYGDRIPIAVLSTTT